MLAYMIVWGGRDEIFDVPFLPPTLYLFFKVKVVHETVQCKA